jgi:MoaA/NifB/PqqE/SkfB family radical SAM enzyme
MSGGEPFLRRDIAEIAEVACRRSRPRVINIPTNGTFPDRVVEAAPRIARALGPGHLIINVSLDGVEEENDEIRGFRDDYRLAKETFDRLKSLKVPNLSVGIHSVISQYNVARFPAIADHLTALRPDQYIAEVAEERRELLTIGTGITPGVEDFDGAVEHLSKRLREFPARGIARITRAIRLVYYDLARETLRRQTQVIPCYAAIASAQIAADGDVWGCCVKARPLGNLRESGYDFSAIWRGETARDERRAIYDKQCHCPLANAAYTSILCDAGSLAKVARRLATGRARSPAGSTGLPQGRTTS